MNPLKYPALAIRPSCTRHIQSLSTLRSPHTSPASLHAPATIRLRSAAAPVSLSQPRSFSSTPSLTSWLFPKRGRSKKQQKGRPRVRTGGSTKGTTVIWGDYGLRMKDHHRRISAASLALGSDTIRRRLKGEKFKLYTRVNAGTGVYTSGNEMRMGKGKGTFDYWAARVAVSKIIFELKGEMHEKVVRDAFRLAAAKMPGTYELVRRGEAPVVGITKMDEYNTLEFMKRPRLTPPANMTAPNLETTADRLPTSSATV